MTFTLCKNVIAAKKVCISIYCQITAKWFYIVFLSVHHLFWCSVSIKLSSRLYVRLCKNYVTPVVMQALFSFDISYYLLILTKSVVSLVFASAVLLLFESSPTGPGYTKNCKFLFISCSSVVDLVHATFVLKYLCLLFIFSRITLTRLYIPIFIYLAKRLNWYSCCGVKHVVLIYIYLF